MSLDWMIGTPTYFYCGEAEKKKGIQREGALDKQTSLVAALPRTIFRGYQDCSIDAGWNL
jgi:uncharacterized ParB-like nuclease family protein